MADRPLTGLFQPKPRQLVIREIVDRSRRRFETLSDADLTEVLEDVLYMERKRLERKPADPAHPHLDALAKALVHGRRDEVTRAGLEIVMGFAEEIHGRFDPRVYRVATGMLPRLVGGLLSRRPERLRDWDLQSEKRVKIEGDLAFIKELAGEATLILAPTHVSNLDSPLIGLALYLAGLPPFVYGAGLNLFSNPVVGWWMQRLGAYTVDRTKKASLYHRVLRDYSTRCLTTRHHSLFFPGGTRARNGALETKLKKGLLGTGILAWQEMLAAKRPDADVYVVPLTLSFQLCLEANTLIDDYLAESGKQRYIISDDEFSQPREVASFARRVLDLDSSVVARFGEPLDVLGNKVPKDPAERREASIRRRGYVTDRSGKVEWDEQRDRVYTDRLEASLISAYQANATVMATHAGAYAAWRCLEEAAQSQDPFRVLRLPHERRIIPQEVYFRRLNAVVAAVRADVAAGKYYVDMPESAGAVLEQAIDRFGRYHKTRALALQGRDVVVDDPKLCLYYRNRLTFAKLEIP